MSAIKNLSISITLDSQQAQLEAVRFSNFITQRFIQAGERLSKALGLGNLSGLRQQLSELQRLSENIGRTVNNSINNAINTADRTTTARTARDRWEEIYKIRDKIQKEADRYLIEQEKATRKQIEQYEKQHQQEVYQSTIAYTNKLKKEQLEAEKKLQREKLTTEKQHQQEVYQSTIAYTNRINKELEAARSAKTTPYLFTPVDYSKTTRSTLSEYQNQLRQVSKIYEQILLMQKQIGNKSLQEAIMNVRAGVITKGPSAVDIQGLGGILKQVDDLKIKAPEAFKQLNSAVTALGINLEQTHTKSSKFISNVISYAKFQLSFYTGMAAIFTVTSAIHSMGRAYIDFAQTLKDIQAITAASNEEIDALGKTAIRVSQETSLSAQEIAKLGLQLIRAGLEADEATRAMEIAAKVAVISGEDVKIVADTIATAIKAWEISAEDTEKIGNTIAAALNYSRLTVEDLGTAFNYMAGVASTFNRTFEETNAILAVYSNLGVRASTIATGWVQLMSEFVAPSKKAQEYLKAIGVAIEEINPATHKFSEILATLEEHGFQSARALEIFQTRAGRALMFALRAGSDAFTDMEEKIRNTRSLADQLEIAMSGPRKAFVEFWNNISAGAIQIGTALGPAIITLTKIINILSSALYHNIHFFTTWPGAILAAIGILYLFRKALLSVASIEIASGMSTISMAFVAIGKVLVSTLPLLEKFRIIMATTSIMMGNIVPIIGALVGGWALDKVLFGSSKIDDIAKAKSELSKTEQELRKLGLQYQETTENINEATNATNRFTEVINKVEEVDITPLMEQWSKFAEQPEIINDNIKKLELSFNKFKENVNNSQPAEDGFFGKLLKQIKDIWYTWQIMNGTRRGFKEEAIETTKEMFSLMDNSTGAYFSSQFKDTYFLSPSSKFDIAQQQFQSNLMNIKIAEAEKRKAQSYANTIEDVWSNMTSLAIKNINKSESQKLSEAVKELKDKFKADTQKLLTPDISTSELLIKIEPLQRAYMNDLQKIYEKYGKKASKTQEKHSDILRNTLIEKFKTDMESFKSQQEQALIAFQEAQMIKEKAIASYNESIRASNELTVSVFESFYDKDIDNATMYWNRKIALAVKGTEDELAIIERSEQFKIDELEKKKQIAQSEYEKLKSMKTIYERYRDSEKAKGDKADALAWEKQINDVQKEMDSLINKQKEYNKEIEAVRGDVFLKQQEIMNKANKNIIEMQKQLEVSKVTQVYEDEDKRLRREKERLQIQLEANDAAKNYVEVSNIRMKLLQNESAIAENNIQKEIALRRKQIELMNNILMGVDDESVKKFWIEKINDYENYIKHLEELSKEQKEKSKALIDAYVTAESDKLASIMLSWSTTLQEIFNLGEDNEIQKIEKKYANLRKKIIESFLELQSVLKKSEIEEYAKKLYAGLVYLEKAESLDLSTAKLNISDFKKEIEDLTASIGNINIPATQWSFSYAEAINKIQEKLYNVGQLIAKYSSDPDLKEKVESLKDMLLDLIALSDKLTNNYRISLTEMQQYFATMQEKIDNLELDLMTEGLEKTLKELEIKLNKELFDQLKDWQSKELITREHPIEIIFKNIKDAGEDLSLVLEKLIELQGKQANSEALYKMIEMIKAMYDLNKFNVSLATTTQPLKDWETILEYQKQEYELSIDLYELTGDWNALELKKLELLDKEHELQMTKYALEILQLEEDIQKDQKHAEILEKKKKLMEDIMAKTDDLNNIRRFDQQLKIYNPVAYAIYNVNKEWNKINEQIIDISKKTYEQLAQSFSDIFYDGITGKLKSLKDYFQDIFNSILRYFTDMLGRMVAKLMSSPLESALSGIFGNIFGGTGFFGSGNANGEDVLGLGSGSFDAGLQNLMSTLAIAGIGYGLGNQLAPNSYAGLGAASGAGVGAIIGSIIPGIGTMIGAVIGSILGGLTGSLFGKNHIPNLALRYRPEGAGDQEYKSRFGFTEWGVRQWDEIGNQAVRQIIRTMDDVRDSFYDFLTTIGGDTSKLNQEWKAKYKPDADTPIEDVLRVWIKEYAEFIMPEIDFSKWQKEGEAISDTIMRILKTISRLPAAIENVGDYIEAIKNGNDAFAQWKEQLKDADEHIKEVKDNLKDATDPTDILNYAEDLKKSIYERYQLEKKMIEDLQNTIENLKIEKTDFNLMIQEKIAELGGSILSNITVSSEGMDIAKNRMLLAENATDKIKYLNDYISYLDKWVDQNISAIEKKYELEKNNINKEIENLEKQKEAIEDHTEALREQKDVIDEQIKNINEQLEVTKKWRDLLKAIRDQIYQMNISTTNPADIFERMNVAWKEIQKYRELYNLSTGEDRITYAQELQSKIQDYLSLAQEAFQRPSNEYKAILDTINPILQQLESDALANIGNEEEIKTLEKELIRLQNESNLIDKEIKEYEKQSAEQTKAIQEKIDYWNEQLKLVDDKVAADVQAFKDSAIQYYQWAQTEGATLYDQAIQDAMEDLKSIIGDGTVEEYIEGLKLATITELQNIETLLQDLLDNFTKTMKEAEMWAQTPGADIADIKEILNLKENPFKKGTEFYDIWKQYKGQEISIELAQTLLSQLLGLETNPFKSDKKKWRQWWNAFHGTTGFAEGGSFYQQTYIPDVLLAEKGIPEHILDEHRLVNIVREAMRSDTKQEYPSGDINVSVVINTEGEVDSKELAKRIENVIVESYKYGKLSRLRG